MRRRSLIYSALVFIALLYILHIAANIYYLYWQFWWFDVLNHFLAGFAGGLATYWVLFHSGIAFEDFPGRGTAILAVFLSVMAVGVSWEIFEYWLGVTDSHEEYFLDVANDLILDGSGAVLAAFLGLRKRT